MDRKTFLKEHIISVVVLICLCIIGATVLAFLDTWVDYEKQQEIQNEINEDCSSVLSAPNFTEYGGKVVSGIASCYTADNDSGFVAVIKVDGDSGNVKLRIGVDSDGRITGIKPLKDKDNSSRSVFKQAYLDKYVGMTADTGSIPEVATLQPNKKEVELATRVYSCVQSAFVQYSMIYSETAIGGEK